MKLEKITIIKDYNTCWKSLVKELKKKFKGQGYERIAEVVNVIQKIESGYKSPNKWKHIGDSLYEIMPFGHENKERVFCYKIADEEIYVIVGFDLYKRHKKIRGDFRKRLIEKGKEYEKRR